MTKQKNNTKAQFILAAVGLVLAFILIASPPPLKMLALALLGLAGLVYYYVTVIRLKRKQKAYDATLLGKLDIQKENCQNKIDALNEEIANIDSSIHELITKLHNNPEASSNAKSETKKLITGFQDEKKLRQSKIDFYYLCQSKLNQIFKNHQLTEDLKRKREKLEALKETNIDEVADMEGMKTYIDYEREYIDTIDTLSLRMLDTRSIENTEVLKLELVEMTKELREL